MWQAKDISEIEKNFRTNKDYGITNEEAKKRLEYFGENVLKDKKKENIFIKFIKQFNDFMIIILIIASIISAIVAKVEGTGDYIDSIIIIAIVIYVISLIIIKVFDRDELYLLPLYRKISKKAKF